MRGGKLSDLFNYLLIYKSDKLATLAIGTPAVVPRRNNTPVAIPGPAQSQPPDPGAGRGRGRGGQTEHRGTAGDLRTK